MSETLLGSGNDGQAPQGGEGAAAGANNGGQQAAGGEGGQQPANGTGNGSNAGNEPNSGQGEWISKFEGETLGWLQNRGLTGKSADEALANLVNGYRNAEKRLGVSADRLLTLPQDPTSEGAMDDVWTKLGRPKDAAGYELDAGDTDLTKQFADGLGEALFKAGVSKDQGQAIEKFLENFLGSQADNEEASTAEQRAAGIAKLKDEWGDTFDLNLALAKEAVKAAGATQEELEALQDAFGDNGDVLLIKFFNRLGQKRGIETGFIAGDPSQLGIGATTPEAAKAKISEMKADPKISRAILENNPNNEHVKRYRALVQLASKSGKAA